MLRALRRALKTRDAEGWLVGGAPRDLLLGRADPDLDAAISADPFPVADALAQAGFGTVVPLSDASPRVARLAGRRELDLAQVEGGEIREDLARRDFTINAIAISLSTRAWIDPYGGIADLRDRRLRMISEANLRDDPLRTLRAARFIASIGLLPDRPTSAACRRSASLLDSAAPERVRVELEKLLSSPRVGPALAWAAAAGLIAPALGRPVTAGQVLAMVRRGSFDAAAVRRLPDDTRLRLRLALLAAALELSPEEAVRWLASRRFSRTAAAGVARLLRLASEAGRLTVADADARWAWVRDAREDAREALLLARLLFPGSSRSLSAAARALAAARKPPRVGGADLLAWLRMSPGPEIGNILRRVEIEGLRGRLRSRNEAKAWLLEAYPPAPGADASP
ncbi:MAG: hypothetical protein LC780_00745 [Acidobacteria bacterium]|nr:hypothetical protein [Acidobacteriota bacterium]